MSWIFGSAAVGAMLMYWGDPDRGRRRRALAADQVRSVTIRAWDVMDTASRDLGNRVEGLLARVRHLGSRDSAVADDAVLIARVRQKIGRVVSNPHAIKVTARNGCVILNGPVLNEESRALLNAVRAVPGVLALEDHLERTDQLPGGPGQQGRRGRSSAALEQWPPAMRAVALVGGGALGAWGLTRRSPVSTLAGVAGLMLAARSIANMPINRMVGVGGSPRIDLHKTIHLGVSPGAAFDLWSSYENFPRFMSHVREVRDLGNGRSHWKVEGPAGVPFEWDAELTESRRPEVLAWRSSPDAMVPNSGVIRFEPEDTGTRVTVHLSYSPPVGAVGQGLAALLGADPKREMDDDLMRMKSFIETGSPPHDAAQRETEQRGTLH